MSKKSRLLKRKSASQVKKGHNTLSQEGKLYFCGFPITEKAKGIFNINMEDLVL